jgi:hypothetical protein
VVWKTDRELYDIWDDKADGKRIWLIDSDMNGEDDILSGEYDDIISAIAERKGTGCDLPDGWTATDITDSLEDYLNPETHY